RVAALLVPADDADHQALAGGLVDLAQEGAAAGAVGVAVTVELELTRHRLPEPVLAGYRLVRRGRVADHLDHLTAGRGAGGQPFGPRHVLHRHARSRLTDPQEGEIVIVARRGFP